MNVYVAVPTRGTMSPRVADAITKAAKGLRTTPVWQVGHLSVGANREAIVHAFMETEADALVMIDDDVLPPADLTPLTYDLYDYDIVAAAYPIFQPRNWPLPVTAAFYINSEGQYGPTQHTTGTRQVDAVGTGCIAIRREVFDQLPVPAFYETTFNGQVVSDDINFCREATDASLRIAVNLDVRCDHITTVSLGAIWQGAHQLTQV